MTFSHRQATCQPRRLTLTPSLAPQLVVQGLTTEPVSFTRPHFVRALDFARVLVRQLCTDIERPRARFPCRGVARPLPRLKPVPLHPLLKVEDDHSVYFAVLYSCFGQPYGEALRRLGVDASCFLLPDGTPVVSLLDTAALPAT